MKVTPLAIPPVLMIEPHVHRDERGFFAETWNRTAFESAGVGPGFVQDNQSHSVQHTLRGMHYQLRRPQGKLVRVVHGAIFDAAVDMRRASKTFGAWVGEVLSSDNCRQLWIPPGFAHGFLVLSQHADVLYKTTDYYDPEDQHYLRWDDATVQIDWPIPSGVELLLSARDREARELGHCRAFE